MGDSGDYWKESRERRRKARSQWHECDCGRKVMPGTACFDCGRVAPGGPEKIQGEAGKGEKA